MLLSSNNEPIINNDVCIAYPVVIGNDGTPLKPSIQFESRIKQNAGLDIDVDLNFVKENPIPDAEFLKAHIVIESLVSSVTFLDNNISFLFAVDYVP